ncbi:MAG: patatin-like phospholipase family protein [Pirellulales bacterium]
MGQAKEFDDVLRQELTDIARRRKQAGFELAGAPAAAADQSSADVARDMKLVGLALSGGGVRSGAVSLGLLQSLYDQGLLNQVDYLSTVSGGGYAGTYLSGVLERFPRDATIDWRLPDAATSAAPGALTNVLSGSANQPAATNGHTANHQPVASPHQRVSLEFGTQPDGAQPPPIRRLIFSGILLRKMGELVSSTLFGVLVNWTMVLGGLTALTTIIALAYRSLDYPLAQDVVSALTYSGDIPRAFFPSALVLAAWLIAQLIRAFSRRLRWAPRMITTASLLALALVGSVLCGVVLIVNTGEVGPATPRSAAQFDEQISAIRDLQQWVWIVLLVSIAVTVVPFLRRNDLLRSGTSSAKTWEGWVARIASWGMLAGVPLVLFGLVVRENLFGANESRDDIGTLYDVQLRDWNSFAERIDREHAMAKEQGTTDSLWPSVVIWSATVEKPPMQKEIQAQIDEALSAKRLESTSSNTAFEAIRVLDDRSRQLDREHWLIGRWGRSLANLFNDGGPVAEQFRISRAQRAIQGAVIERMNLLLANPEFYSLFPATIDSAQLDGPAEKQRAADWLSARQTASELQAAATLHRAPTDGEIAGALPNQNEFVRANRKLLEMWYQGEIYPPSTVFSRIVWPYDQANRLWILLWGACAFLGIGLLVDVNLTSAHFYYRQRLAEVWTLAHANGSGIALADMKNTDCGGPYHLINATVNLIGPRRDPSSEPTEGFLLSRRFCGSRRVEFESTESFAGSGIISLADAMAISGAAVSPIAVLNNPMLFYALLLTNARLGQWVPNPGERRLLHRYPTFIRAILSYFLSKPERADYLYVSDGGHHDNTGIEALLERRCRVIIACDASCDPNHQFLDLLRLMRRMMLFSGVSFSAADGERLSLDALVPDLETRLTRDHIVPIRVHFPEGGECGWLLYMKSSLTGDEPPNLLRYREEDKEFPHDPTSDLFYEPRRFECYRTLGCHLGERLKEFLQPDEALLARPWLKDHDFAQAPQETAAGNDERSLRVLMQRVLQDILDGKQFSSADLVDGLHAISNGSPKVKPKRPAPKKAAPKAKKSGSSKSKTPDD